MTLHISVDELMPRSWLGFSFGAWASICGTVVLCSFLYTDHQNVDLLVTPHSEMRQLLDVAEDVGAAKIEAKRLAGSVESLKVNDLMSPTAQKIDDGINRLKSLESEASSLKTELQKAAVVEQSFDPNRNTIGNSIVSSSSSKKGNMKSEYAAYVIFAVRRTLRREIGGSDMFILYP